MDERPPGAAKSEPPQGDSGAPSLTTPSEAEPPPSAGAPASEVVGGDTTAETSSERASSAPATERDEAAEKGAADTSEDTRDPRADREGAPPAAPSSTSRLLRRYALPAVLAVGLLETAAHLYQTRPVDEAGAYERAAAHVRASIGPADGLAFYPDWSSRPGRLHFKELATLEREGPTDDARYPRIFVVRNRGGSGGPQGWKTVAHEDFGVVSVDTLENPKPEPPLWDAMRAFEARSVEAFVHGPTENRTCPWTEDRGNAPPWDPAVPPRRFQCDNVGVGTMLTMVRAYHGLYCIAAMPMVAPRALRLRFTDVKFGQKIVVHHVVQQSFEDPKHAPVTARYWAELAEDRMAMRPVGDAVYRDGAGVVETAFSTPELAGKVGALGVDVQSSTQEARHYCFEVTTR